MAGRTFDEAGQASDSRSRAGVRARGIKPTESVLDRLAAAGNHAVAGLLARDRRRGETERAVRLEGIGTFSIRSAELDHASRACNVTREIDQSSQVIHRAMQNRTRIPSVDLIETQFLDSGEPKQTEFPLLRNAVVTRSSFEKGTLARADQVEIHHVTLAAMENAEKR